jgi:hypothetical protein
MSSKIVGLQLFEPDLCNLKERFITTKVANVWGGLR